MPAIYLCVISVSFFCTLLLFFLKQAQKDEGQIDSERDALAS